MINYALVCLLVHRTITQKQNTYREKKSAAMLLSIIYISLCGEDGVSKIKSIAIKNAKVTFNVCISHKDGFF